MKPDLAGLRNYQLLGGLGLGVLVLLPLQQTPPTHDPVARLILLLLPALLALAGLFGLLGLREVSPLWALILFGVNQLLLRHDVGRGGGGGWRRGDGLDPLDFALSLAALAYVGAHYRLNALRSRPVPRDPRRREKLPPRPVARAEVLGLLVPLPACALLAAVVWFLVADRDRFAGLPPNLQRLLLLTWGLGISFFVAGQVFGTWRRAAMTRTAARILLQDVLWQETRGEQRRLNRWLAWRKVRRGEEPGPANRGETRGDGDAFLGA